MALRPCPECSTPISHKATKCPTCDRPDPFHRKVKGFMLRMLLGGAIMVVCASYLWYVAVPNIKHDIANNFHQR